MFAVIKTGGKQYRVNDGDVIVVEKLSGEPGKSIKFDQVLMLGEDGKAPKVGAPIIANATVTGEVIEQGRGDKIVVFKKKRRKRYRRKLGHRQDQTVLRITDINGTGSKKTTAKAKADDSLAEKAKPTTKAAAKEKAPAKSKAKTSTKTTAAAKEKAPRKKKAPAKPKAPSKSSEE